MGLLPRRARTPAETIALLEALGTAGAREAMDRAADGGPAALDALLQALVRRVPFDNDAHRADFFADLDECLSRLARGHPDRFIAGVQRWPALLERDAVVVGIDADGDGHVCRIVLRSSG